MSLRIVSSKVHQTCVQNTLLQDQTLNTPVSTRPLPRTSASFCWFYSVHLNQPPLASKLKLHSEKVFVNMGFSSRSLRTESFYTTSHISQSIPSSTVSDSVRRQPLCNPRLINCHILNFSNWQTPRSASTMKSEASFSRSSNRRTDSNTSTASSTSTASYQTTSDNSRKVSTGSINANSYCGRHSDQYLFGGWGPIVKGVFSQRKH